MHLAVTGMLDQQPDMVVSGINSGSNMDDDTVYSGTVAAATEGFLLGIPSIAVSLEGRKFANYEAAAMIAAMACINEDGSPIAKMMTMCSLDVMGAPESADEYMTMLAEDIKEIEFIYLMKARQWLMAGNMDMFDHYLVRRMALKSFKHSRMREICQCRKAMIQNTVVGSIDSWEKNVAERFVHEDESRGKNNDKHGPLHLRHQRR